MSVNIRDQRKEALEYLEDKKVLRLFDTLGVRLAQEKPESPNDFLLSELRAMQALKSENKQAKLFTDSDIENMFDIFDITGRGYLDNAQVEKALQAVGIKEPKTPIPPIDRINRRTFLDYM